MLRILSLIAITMTIFNVSHAEHIWHTGYRKVVVEDTARYRVIYVHIANDRLLDKQDVKYEMLSVGDKKITYGGYGTYLADSIYSTFKVLPPWEERRKIIRECEPIPQSITIDLKNGTSQSD